jgi:eukaryotic-like serine/threonine-protein kinase
MLLHVPLSPLRLPHRSVLLLQPDNILVSTTGDTFKLADFGIATQLDGPQDLARTNVGTTLYMAPERVDSSSVAGGSLGGGYSYASDVWAAGLSLLAVAAGRSPYPDPSYWALVQVCGWIESSLMQVRTGS